KPQRLFGVVSNSIDHHALVGCGVARGRKDLFRVVSIETQHAGLKFLLAQHLRKLPADGHHVDPELLEAVLQEGIAGLVYTYTGNLGHYLGKSGSCIPHQASPWLLSIL